MTTRSVRMLGGTLLSLACAQALAQNAGDTAVDLQNKARVQQQIERELEDNRRRAESGQKAHDGPTTDAGAPTEAGPEGPTFPIHDIHVDTGAFDPGVDLSDILASYSGRALGQQDLFGLVRELTNRYVRAGYSTTTIGLVPGNLDTGVVRLRVHWGLVEGWKIDDKPPTTFSERRIVAQALPGAIGRPLNIRAIDQAIENLNNAKKSARIDVEPGTRDGVSFLHVRTEASQAPRFTLGADNSGDRTPTHGRYRFNGSATFGDVLLGNDTLSLNGSSRRFRDDGSNYEYSLGAAFGLPIGGARTDLRFNETRYKTRAEGYYGSYSTSGASRTIGLKQAFVLNRDAASKLTGFAEVEHRSSANYIEGSLLDVNSVPYTTLGYGLQAVTQWFGGSLYADVAMVTGMPWWNGDTGAAAANGQPRHFRKLTFNGGWNRAVPIGARRFDYSLRVGGQYSNDAMLASYKQSLGDEYTVRGFKGGALSGDRGVFVSNTFSTQVKLGPLVVSPYLGLDAGYAEDRFAVGPRDRTVAGGALGLRMSHRASTFSLGWAPPLRVPGTAGDAGPVVYLSLGSSL